MDVWGGWELSGWLPTLATERQQLHEEIDASGGDAVRRGPCREGPMLTWGRRYHMKHNHRSSNIDRMCIRWQWRMPAQEGEGTGAEEDERGAA